MMIILAILTGMITGIISGMLGIGGGAIMVVIAIALLNVSQHVAQAAALTAIIPTALTGVYKHHRNGLINWQIGLYMSIGGVIGGLVGSYGANIMDEVVLRKVFSIFFALIGIKLLVSSYKKDTKEKAHSSSSDNYNTNSQNSR
ncbi:sulfite exporter TauE/SafE family protein [Pelosinus sp. IPA-1]|uniref:sulfite exporter TauE/SafE family protein n=1 Tax=Pelosinus sp. IPA-1 TaxID=3029569 RepID=UPI0024361FA0|nr:sulfite exporter TauE/SafE family protein [Pelosinus sp. IPA-1]GMA98532.1 hypothetical protein PIPA1_13320 [Pelosinus sp. IPA-1]